MKLRSLLLTSLLVFLGPVLSAREFTLMVYNVNHFFDIDGLALFPEFSGQGKSQYGPKQLYTKVHNLGAVLKKVDAGKGPDIILFQEFEYDFTPESTVDDYDAFLARFESIPLKTMLVDDFKPEYAGLPIEAFVLKYLAEIGLGRYHVATYTGEREANPDKPVPHVNTILSRFPITDVKAYEQVDARETVEAHIDIDGHKLIVFDNHWKSNRGGLQETEEKRVLNAKVQRARIDALLEADPNTDFVIGGDLNCQYNQAQRFPRLPTTAINHTLRAIGDEMEIRSGGKWDLYNLWYDLPYEERLSDTFSGEWGTLMHLIIPRGLYDKRGIQYVDNSFEVLILPGMNADARWNTPIRPDLSTEFGSGYSDHFPLLARFRTVDTNDAVSYVTLENPGTEQKRDSKPLEVDYAISKSQAPLMGSLLKGMSREELRSLYGELVEVKASINPGKRPSVKIGSQKYEIFSYKRELLDSFRNMKQNQRVHFYGILGEYKGKTQFVVNDASWIVQ